jgi:hypothetical protein
MRNWSQSLRFDFRASGIITLKDPRHLAGDLVCREKVNMLTVSATYAVPSLIGRGLTEPQARAALVKARIYGTHTALAGVKPIRVSYSRDKFTIVVPR